MRNRLLFLLLILPISSAIAASVGFMVREAQLRVTPNSDAKTVFKVKAGKAIHVLKRKGGWYQITTSEESKETTGWVRMTSLRLGASTKKSGDSGLFSTFSFFSKGSSDNVVASTGVRGLDADDFTEAEPNHKAVKKLDTYAVNKKTARQFARAGNLKPVSIKFKQIVGGAK